MSSIPGQSVFFKSRGLIAALVIILLFILMATFLKSVLFGLMLAGFFLPLQQWYQHRFFPGPAGKALLGVIHAISAPIRVPAAAIRARLTRKPVFRNPAEEAEHAQKEETRKHEAEVARACQATLATVVLVGIFVTAAITALSVSYVSGVHASAQAWVEHNIAGEKKAESGWRTVASQAYQRLETLRPKLEGIPGFKAAQEKVNAFLEAESNQTKAVQFISSKLGGIFSAAGSVMGAVAGFVVQAVLTLFFCSFFLQKLGEFQTGENHSFGRYLTEGLFRSHWLPNASEETITQAESIINSIIEKLRTWVKGYLWIIIIESIIYSSVFFLLGVPYAPVFGIIAGMTVLLPFIGPVVSGALTIIVTYALVQPSIAVVFLLLLTYLVMNVVVEQIFLYPMLIGEALGLNALETVMVVLLGGLFAGLTGMIFAVPAASVLKSLIPMVYGCWRTAPDGTSSSNGSVKW